MRKNIKLGVGCTSKLTQYSNSHWLSYASGDDS